MFTQVVESVTSAHNDGGDDYDDDDDDYDNGVGNDDMCS